VAELRLDLRREAWQQGIESWMLGLGPGPHFKMPAAILPGRLAKHDDPVYHLYPKPSATPNYEAHNTLLDLDCGLELCLARDHGFFHHLQS
jgi:hypothetical protein